MRGSSVDVRFERHRDSIKGTNPAFRKIAFIDRQFRGTWPQHNEEWHCRVVGDSKPSDPNSGAYFLMPLYRLVEKPEWTIDTDGPDPVVTLTVRYGTRVLAEKSRQWTATNEADIEADWPGWVRDRVRLLVVVQHNWGVSWGGADSLKVRVVHGQRRCGKELDSPSWLIETASEIDPNWPDEVRRDALSYCRELVGRRRERARAESIGRQTGLKSKLGNPQAVTVVKVERTSHRVTKQLLVEDEYRNDVLFVDGVRVGLYDDYSHYPPGLFDNDVEGLHLTLSNGNTISVYSHNMPLILQWRQTGSGWVPDKAYHFVKERALNYVNRKSLTWSDATKLNVGDELALEYPFQWLSDEWLSNGLYWFPKLRPEGSEWREYPVPAVPRECWDLFLSGLEGKYLVDWLPYHRQVTTARAEPAEPRLTERQAKVQSVISGTMWQGSGDNCKRVAVGRNMVFHVTRPGADTLYLVDNPGVGALYVFATEAEALALADGTVSRTDAIKAGAERIIHTEGWQDRLAARLSVGVPLPA